jgi:hypothetical protein
LRANEYACIFTHVARRLHQQPLYLEHADADDLDQLARETRLPKQTLLREAVTDLFVKYRGKGMLRPQVPKKENILDVATLRREVTREILAGASIDVEALISSGELTPKGPKGWYVLRGLDVLPKVKQVLRAIEHRTVRGKHEVRVQLGSVKKFKTLAAQLRSSGS